MIEKEERSDVPCYRMKQIVKRANKISSEMASAFSEAWSAFTADEGVQAMRIDTEALRSDTGEITTSL